MANTLDIFGVLICTLNVGLNLWDKNLVAAIGWFVAVLCYIRIFVLQELHDE